MGFGRAPVGGEMGFGRAPVGGEVGFGRAVGGEVGFGEFFERRIDGRGFRFGGNSGRG